MEPSCGVWRLALLRKALEAEVIPVGRTARASVDEDFVVSASCVRLLVWALGLLSLLSLRPSVRTGERSVAGWAFWTQLLCWPCWQPVFYF